MAVIQLINPSVPTVLVQNIIYALPASPCMVTSGVMIQKSILFEGPFADWTGITSGIYNPANGFVKCLTGNTTINAVKLKMNELDDPPIVPPVTPFGGLVSATNLVSYWKLDETTGNRLDSFGTNHLTPTNTPVSAVGKIGNSCDFESSSSQYLRHPDPLPLGDEDFTYTLWFKRETFGIAQQLLAKDSDAGNYYRQYFLTILATGELSWTFMPDGGISYLPTTFSFNDTNWHFVIFGYDSVANRMQIQIDNGVIETKISTFPPQNYGLGNVTIGCREYTGYREYFDGLIDEVGLWRRVLTTQERTALWNSGNGLAF